MNEISARPNDFKIGLFVLAASGLLLAGLFVFGGSRVFQKKIVEETCVSGSAGGLKEGAPVLLHGVPVGEVTRINFSWNVYGHSQPRCVIVEFQLRGSAAPVPPGKDFARQMRAEVERGLRARIQSQGLVGATVLSLEYVDPREYPPPELPWKPRHIYIPAAPGQFKEMLTALEKTIARVQEIDVQGIVTSLERDLAAAERLINHLDQANFGRIADNADALVTELREATTQLRSLVGVTRATGGSNAAEVTARLEGLLTGLQESVERVNRILANLDTASFNEAIANAERATEQLDEALRQFKTYPSGVLFGKPPPPARSVEGIRR